MSIVLVDKKIGDEIYDNFEFRASEKVIGDSDKFRIFKKLLEDL